MAPKGLEIKFDIRNIAKPRIAKGAGIFKLIYLWKLCIDPLTGKHQWHSKQLRFEQKKSIKLGWRPF